MADYKKKVTLKYDILDSEGNATDKEGKAYGTRQYTGYLDESGNPKGGSLFVNAYNNNKNNVKNYVYTDPNDSESYTPTEDAEVSIGIMRSGDSADITLYGPEWLTEQVKNSDWFKNNYDNKTFRKFAEAYVNNPTGTMIDPSDDTKTITYKEAWDKYAQAFSETAQAYQDMAHFKDTVEGVYGVQLNDEQAIIAGTNYDKNDYDKSGAVYIPEWLAEKHDFSKYDSWDPDKKTISAGDFFDAYYSTANWDANGIREMKDLVRRKTEQYATYAASSVDRENKPSLDQDDYKEEVARTISLGHIISSNDAESDFWMDSAMFTAGFAGGFIDGCMNFFTGAGQTLTDIFRWPIDQVHDFARDVIGMDEEGARVFTLVTDPIAAIGYTALSAMGEVASSLQDPEGFKNFSAEMEKDLGAIFDLSGDNAFSEYRDQWKQGTEAFWTGTKDLSAKVEAGKFLGNVTFKIIENIILLNAAGAKFGKIFTGGEKAAAAAASTAESAAATTAAAAGTAEAVATTKGLATSMKLLVNAGREKAVSTFIGTVGLTANAGLQGVIETLADDSDTFRALVANGDTSIVGTLMKNFGYNALGEGMGMGMSKISQTTGAKVVSGAATKVTNKIAHYRYSGIHKLMQKVFGENPKNAKIANKMTYVAKQAEATADVANVKLMEGVFEGGVKGASQRFLANYAEQQTQIAERIAIENAYDALNGSIKQAMKKAEMTMDQETIENFYATAKETFKEDSALIKQGILTKSEIPGNKLSQEAADYLSYKAHAIRYENISKNLAKSGKTLSETDQAIYDSVSRKLGELAGKLGNEYMTQLDAYFNSIGKYQRALNDYKIANKLFTDDTELQNQVDLLNNGQWGAKGDQYVHTERYFEGENYAERFLRGKTPTKPASAKVNKSLGQDIDEHFVDPSTLLMLDLSKTASLKVQADWRAALVNSTGAYKNVAVTGKEKKLADNFAKMRKQNLKDFSVDGNANSTISSTLREAFGKNDILAKAFGKNKFKMEVIKTASSTSKNAQKAINNTLGLTDSGTADITVGAFTAEDIAEINSRLIKNVIPDYTMDGMRAADLDAWVSDMPESSQKLLHSVIENEGKNFNFTNAKAYIKEHPEFRTVLQRNYILNNKEIRATKAYRDVLVGRRTAMLNARDYVFLKQNVEDFENSEIILNANKAGEDITGKYGKAYLNSVHATTNNIIAAMQGVTKENGSSMAIVKGLQDAGATEAASVRYVTLHNLKNLTKGDIKKALMKGRFADKELIEASKKITADSAWKYVENTSDAIYKEIQSEYNVALRQMVDGGFGDVIDPSEVYDRVASYIGEIQGTLKANDVVAFPDVAGGEIKYIKVDPLTADLYNLRPGSFTMTMDDYGSGAQHVINFFNKMNRLFQWGTTGFSLTSFVNQWFRDSFNAVVIGGARPFIDFGVGLEASKSILGKEVSGKITKSFIAQYGDTIAKNLEESMGPEAWARFTKSVTDAGGDINTAATRYVVKTMGYGSLPGQEMLTTVGLYEGGKTSAKFQGEMNDVRAEMMENATARTDTLFSKDGVKKAMGPIERARRWISEKQLGSWREQTLRQNVYTSAYGRALDAGMCTSEAEAYATRFALDATTDFARPLMIGDSIAKSVPYFGAAVNGIESFYRLMEIDPAGIAGRFIGGIALPVMTAVGKSLSDPTNREIYKNIPEYEKEDALVFVYNGEVISIPLPQEISAYAAPFRQAVEAAYDANDNSWANLVSADILAISPVDLSGFVNLDANTLTGDPSFGDRIARGTEKAISGLMPAAAKAAYKAVTGRDPYTGRSIDKSYTYVDDEGNIQIMDNTQSAFANWLSDVFGNELRPSSAYSIFKDLLGRAGMNLADSIVTTLTKGVGQGAKVLAEQAGKGALGVVSPDVYNQGRNDWYAAVRQLEQEKQAIQSDKAYQNLAQQISFETDPNKLKQLYAKSDEYIYNFQKKVCDMVNALKEKYPGMYNRTRQAAVISLLNMNSGIAGAKSAYARSLSKELYYQGRTNAIAGMQAMGFTSPEDDTILGYGYMDGNEYKFKYNNPLVILNMGNTVYGQSNINKANIEAILDTYELDRGKMFGDDYKAAQTKADKKAYKAEWNKKVVTALAPYIQQHGVEQVLADYETRDLLDNYLFIDNPYKTKDYLYKIFGGEE